MSTARVVSLVPSVTETLLAWGVTPVAVTRFCEAPGVPTVGGTKNPDVGAIVALSPDVVVMDTEENRAEDFEALRASGMVVHATSVRALADVAPTLAGLVIAVGHRGAPVTKIKVAAAPAASAARAGPTGPAPAPEAAGATAAPQPRAWVPIWRRPWMSIGGGTYGSSLLAAAGIVNVCQEFADPYPTMELGDVGHLHPDVILAPSEPYPFAERHRSQLEAVAPVLFVDGQDLFWWGSRTPAALNRLRELAATIAGAPTSPPAPHHW
jgi:ABC-type Fe3+-hydroxamate transport system substrate-binding protein